MSDERPYGGGPGVAYPCRGRWPRVAAACRLIRETGCRWPIQVWYRAPDVVDPVLADRWDVDLVDLDETERTFGVDPGARDVDTVYRYTNFDFVLLLGPDEYPSRAPCRLGPVVDRVELVWWAGPDGTPQETPLVINRTKYNLQTVVTTGRSPGKSVNAATFAAARGLRLVRAADADLDPACPMGRRLKALLQDSGVLPSDPSTTSISGAAGSATPS